MRPNRYALFSIALLALAFALPAQAQYGTGVVVQVPEATGAITLDGDGSEADWATAAEVDVVANWNGGYYEGWGDPEVADVVVPAKLLWSEGTLYLFVQFFDFQDLWFGAPGEPYNGEQLLVGVDLTHEGDDQVDENYGGWPDNAPDLGPTTYKISGAPDVGITHNWGFDGITPVDSGWVAGEVYVDEGSFEWGVEMAIYGDEITKGGEIGFNIGGGTGDEAMLADTTLFGDTVYGYFSWQAQAPPGSAGGDVMNNSASFATLSFVTTVANEEVPGAREGFALHRNAPNPFRASTTLGYTLAEAGQVELAVYDVLGRRVALVENGVRPAGDHQAVLHADALPNGVYVARLVVDGEVVATRRLMRAH
jgi:hypothetical protein